jgi:hypothetical protein
MRVRSNRERSLAGKRATISKRSRDGNVRDGEPLNELLRERERTVGFFFRFNFFFNFFFLKKKLGEMTTGQVASHSADVRFAIGASRDLQERTHGRWDLLSCRSR